MSARSRIQSGEQQLLLLGLPVGRLVWATGLIVGLPGQRESGHGMSRAAHTELEDAVSLHEEI